MDQFVGYLLYAQSFQQCMTNCIAVAQPDREMKRAIKERLGHVIDDWFYTLVYRPALIRVGLGETGLPARIGLNPDILRVARRNAAACASAAKRCHHDPSLVGLDHARALETGMLRRTYPHVSKFAWRRARFLSKGENGKSHEDIIHDIQLMALRSFRWYYPFRDGTHMDNTVRSSVTNRGLSYVKHHTRACRSRMVTDENGVTHAIESYDERALDIATSCTHEERNVAVGIDIARLAQRNDGVGQLVRLLCDEARQDQFLAWLAEHEPGAVRPGWSMARCAAATPYSLSYWLGHFFSQRPSTMRRALAEVREYAAA